MLKWCRCGFESQKNHTVDVISIASVGVFRVLGWGLGGVGGGNMIPQRAAVWKRSRTGKRRFAANNFIGCCSGLVQSFFGVGLGSVAAQDVHCAGLRSAKQIYSSSPGIFFDPNNSAFLILFFCWSVFQWTCANQATSSSSSCADWHDRALKCSWTCLARVNLACPQSYRTLHGEAKKEQKWICSTQGKIPRPGRPEPHN